MFDSRIFGSAYAALALTASRAKLAAILYEASPASPSARYDAPHPP
jgi:hypothetical protein